MSHSPTSYIDGVPVKISEKYKPPPKISLPQKIVHCLAHCTSSANNDQIRNSKTCQYDFQMEHQTQIALSSWKNVRQQDRFARKDRIRQRQIDRQRQLDEHQKQMLTAVSYPNAEDLSSDEEDREISSEEKSTVSAVGTPSTNGSEAVSQTSPTEVSVVPINQEPKQRFDTILMPTIMAEQAKPDSHWSFSSKIANITHSNLSSEISNRYTSSSAFEKINYSDFENDTSSPFDNVELKTIDDLDILAQVLKQNYLTTNTDSPSEQVGEEENITENENQTYDRHNTDANQIAATNRISIVPKLSTSSVNENALNSNGEGSKPQPIFNHSSSGYYTANHQAYASNYVYDNQNQLTYSGSPISPHQIHATNIPMQHVYFNYQNQTVTGLSQSENHSGCNERYAVACGIHVPQNASSIVPDPTATTSIKANSVPDILRQLKTSSGNALH